MVNETVNCGTFIDGGIG